MAMAMGAGVITAQLTTVEKPRQKEMSVIGKPVPAIEARYKVTGEARYLADIELPGMLYGKILRSPHAHARIVRIDTSRAERLPGVEAVITAEDTPKRKFSFIQELADDYPLAVDKVRFVGDEVAAVAAVTPEIAEEAIQLIDVEYEVLPAVFDPLEAMKEGAPAIHEGGNIAYELHKGDGDIEAALAASDYVIEEYFSTSKQAHVAMEPRGCLAYWDRTGLLTIWHQTQAPHTLAEELSRTLDKPVHEIRIITPEVGGGFGGRMVMDMIVPITAILSRKTGRPVRVVKTREEEFQTSRTRYPYHYRVRLGLTRDGLLTAIHIDVTGDNGAYNDKGPATLSFAAGTNAIAYQANNPVIRHDARLVYTNKEPGTAFRGFGHIEEKFAVESALNRAAAELGIDPFEIRRRNTSRPSDWWCLDRVKEYIGWPNPAPAAPARPGRRRGCGIAMSSETGAGVRYYGFNATEAMVKVNRDGSVTLIYPGTDTGSGNRTVMVQIVAEELGIPVDRIRVVMHDTWVVPYDLGSWASRTTYVCGNAVLAAARDARRQLFAIAAEILEASPDELDAANGKVFVASDPSRSITTDELIYHVFSVKGTLIIGKGQFFDEIAPRCRVGGDTADYFPVIASSVHYAEVEVDEETGLVEVTRYVAGHDLGRVINPLGATGQIEGGVVQGIGFALWEDLVYDEAGQILNPNLIEYAVPLMDRVPTVETLFIEEGDSEGPYGAKGLGEVPIGGPAPAIHTAIWQAVGARPNVLPMNPERVWRAMRARDVRERKDGKHG